MSRLNEYEDLSIKKLGQSIYDGKWSNEGLVEIIKLCGEYLNIKTIPDYCKKNGISYQGAKKETRTRKIETLFGIKFIIDNY